MGLEDFLRSVQRAVNDKLLELLPGSPPFGKKLYDAVLYSVTSGGKRVRPAICLASCEAVGGSWDDALIPACAIEMVHTYSLIHDDLPALDNDKLRRGKPTTWVEFGESSAILAGDALLNRAFEVLSGWDFDCERKVRVMEEVSAASGMEGMVLGQQCDMDAEGREDVSLEELLFIHRHKTGRLIEASAVSGAISGGAGEDEISALRVYGRSIGLAFQIVDDVLDVVSKTEVLGKSAGSDVERGKLTFVRFFGVEGSMRRAREEVERAISSVERFGKGAENLIMVARFICERGY